jgi:transcriptional regulator with GAF, ATPase, and Fis domain
VTAGVDTGKEAISGGDELGIGTAQGNQLLLTDPTVSRHHCTIAVTPKGFLLRDLGSTNGTVLGDSRVESAYPEPGMRIRVGQTALVFELLGTEIHEPLSDEESFEQALGSSEAMRFVFAVLARAAQSETTVLLEGETGTGKGLLARALHQRSRRASGPLIEVDCSAIPPTLIESELFGHERGAFTGADRAREGAFEAAQGGTIFLDEIGELPLEMQPKLLRALEERTIKRIGTTTTTRLDVRVIAATNRDLRLEVNRGGFRADLFYRLAVLRVRVPPLRERREDIAVLAAQF